MFSVLPRTEQAVCEMALGVRHAERTGAGSSDAADRSPRGVHPAPSGRAPWPLTGASARLPGPEFPSSNGAATADESARGSLGAHGKPLG